MVRQVNYAEPAERERWTLEICLTGFVRARAQPDAPTRGRRGRPGALSMAAIARPEAEPEYEASAEGRQPDKSRLVIMVLAYNSRAPETRRCNSPRRIRNLHAMGEM